MSEHSRWMTIGSVSENRFLFSRSEPQDPFGLERRGEGRDERGEGRGEGGVRIPWPTQGCNPWDDENAGMWGGQEVW